LADRYRIEREIGSGGMATVYLTHDVHHDRPVALKVLHPELAAALGPERFLREIRTTARLQHPHILPVLDSGEAAETLWYTMPYVEGESLRDRLHRETQLPLDEALGIAREVGLALDYAHRHGVMHRDIKPENILLSDGQALVADFGVARAPEQGMEVKLTETGLAVGTPAYMSPEQATGAQVDARSDIYALGCVLYEMLAGEPPYTGPTPQALIAKRFTEPVPSIRRIREGVPEVVERALTRALAKGPADRYRTAAEFVRALDVTTATPPSAVTPPTASAIALAGGRRRVTRRAVGLGIAALLGVAAVVMALLSRARRAPNALDDNLLAVAPFDVLDSRLGLWREGMVDLLARTFDGAGALRAVPPTAAVRQWRGRADPEAAAAFARRFGARLAVFGTVLPAGRDSVRLRAALLEVARGRVVAEVEVQGSAEDIAPLADSAAIGLLRGLGAERAVGAVRSASLGARSVPALKAFLQGEQLYRHGDWDAAIEAYRRATELDTTFALAYFHRADAEGWRESFTDTLSNTLFLRAGALNHGLSPRESLLIAAESLAAATNLTSDDPGTWRRLKRQRDILEAAVRQYPDDAEAWFHFADARYHLSFGPGLESRPADVARALDRALAADSAFAPAYPHRIELAFGLEGPTAARALIARYLALQPGPTEAQAMRLLDAMLNPAWTRSPQVERMLATLPAEALRRASMAVEGWPDSMETALRIMRALPRARPVRSRQMASEYMKTLPPSVLGVYGHLREALRAARVPEFVTVLAGQFGILPDDSVRAVIARSPGPPWAYMVWLAASHDTVVLAGMVRIADSLARLPGQGTDRRRSATLNRQASRAYLALARYDTAAALEALQAVPDTLLGSPEMRLMKAQLLAAHGQDPKAAKVLDEALWAGVLSVPTQLERARIAERLGERPRAIEGFQYVASMWRHADPELQPFVAEAREALERLTAGAGR
jgi:serine/threonine-protein kinase